ncbi:MAG: hypothetical protein HQL77_12335 [Magnetococcales bacterium]|nr:hypothetical protein [Magnetococcales bacterium]
MEPALGGIARLRLWYVLKTLLVGYGYGWQAVANQDACDLCIVPWDCPPVSITGQRPMVMLPVLESTLIDPERFQPQRILRSGGVVVFTTGERVTDDEPLWVHGPGDLRTLRFDLLAMAFWLLTGSHETHSPRGNTIRVERDNILVREGLLMTPILEEYSEVLFGTFKDQAPPWPRWKNKARYAVTLTHDVDFPSFIRWIAAAKFLLVQRDPLKMWRDLFAKAPDYWLFNDVIAEEGDRGLRSAFYFASVPGKWANLAKGTLDTFYDIADQKFLSLFEQLRSQGFEIGLHANCQAHTSEQQFSRELQTLIQYRGGGSDCGNRHHCWLLDPANPNETLAMHARIGLVYDTSLMFHYFNGLRRGTVLPFHPFDASRNEAIQTLQLPPVCMDDYLFTYRILNNIHDPLTHLGDWLAIGQRFGGLLMVDYHSHFFHPVRFRRERASYLYFLNRLQEDDMVWVATPMEIAKHWLEREKGIAKESFDEY